MNTVIETTLRKKNNNKLFDKFWYQTREEKFLKLPENGLYIDSIGLVAYGVNQSRIGMGIDENFEKKDKKHEKEVNNE